MRKIVPEKLELARIRDGRYGSDPSYGLTGAFSIHGPCGERLMIVSSDASVPGSGGWDHVSASTKRRTPNWTEMCWVKSLFFEPEEYAVQFHPPESDYVNNHPHCLHLWRHATLDMPRPPSIMVGIKSLGVLSEAG